MKFPFVFFRAWRSVSSNKVNRRCLQEWALSPDIPIVTETSIKNQLDELSIQYKDGYTCLHVTDCLCCRNLPGAKNSADIFVNKRTGFFLCENCKVIGDWPDYSSLLTKVKGEEVDVTLYKKYWERYDKDTAGWNEVVSITEPLSSYSEVEHEDVLKEFKLPTFPQTVSDKLGIRINVEKSVLYFPLQCPGSPVVGYKTYSKDSKDFKENTFPRIECPGFLLYSAPSEPTTLAAAVVVANISDFLALVSLNLPNYDIICLQYGVTYLPQSTLPFLEKYGKIILWFGEGGLDAIGNVARKLVEKRCFAVRPTENQKSASEALSKNQDINNILFKAKLTWHQFVTSFSSFREEVLSNLQNADQASGVQWKRFPALTKILKGHRRGELTILTGPTGVGKTTFLSEYSLDLAQQGVNTLWGSFEIKNTRLAKIMLTQYAEGPIPENVKDYNELCDRFEELPIFFLTLHGQQDLAVVMDAVKHCSYIYDIAHVIIDNVQFMIEMSHDAAQLDRFWRQDFMIQSFRNFATLFNCHVTLVMHPKKIEGDDLSVNSIFGGAKASQEADNVLIMQRKQLNTFGVKKYLQISKNRFAGDLGLFPLVFDKPSLCFSKTGNSNKTQNKQALSAELCNEHYDSDFNLESEAEKL